MTAIQQIVGDATTPTAGDIVLHDLLVGLGLSVTYVSDETAENTAGFDGVVIANSVVAATLGTKYAACTLPVVFHESGYVDTMLLCDIDAFTIDSNTTLTTVTDSHPILSGPYGPFTGTVTIYSAPTNFFMNIDSSATTIASGVIIVANHPTNAVNKIILACESGATLSGGGAAPNKRAFLFPHETDIGLLHANGTAILKNTYTWAFIAATPSTLFYVKA